MVFDKSKSNLVHFTLWNYNPINDNFYGDHWNGEDFSIFSPEQPAIRTQSLNDALVRFKDKQLSVQLDRFAERSQSVTEFLDLPEKVRGRPEVLSRRRSVDILPTPETHFDIVSAFFDTAKPEVHHGGRALDAVIRPCKFYFLDF